MDAADLAAKKQVLALEGIIEDVKAALQQHAQDKAALETQSLFIIRHLLRSSIHGDYAVAAISKEKEDAVAAAALVPSSASSSFSVLRLLNSLLVCRLIGSNHSCNRALVAVHFRIPVFCEGDADRRCAHHLLASLVLFVINYSTSEP